MVVDRPVKLIIVTALITSAVAIGVGSVASAADDNSFTVTITDINTSVVEGETVVIEANITNRGSEADSEQIHLKQNGTIVDSVKNPPVTLASGESTGVMLEWTPEYGDAGPAELAVKSDYHEAFRTIDVGEGPTFPVAIDSTSGPVVGGESLTVSVTVRNTGETTATTPVDLFVTNELQAQKSVELAAGETKQVYLTWETTQDDTGARAVEVVSANATAESRVRIFDSKEVVSTDTATETTANEGQDTETPVSERQNTEADAETATDAAGTADGGGPGFSVTVALLALLATVLLGYGRYRNQGSDG